MVMILHMTEGGHPDAAPDNLKNVSIHAYGEDDNVVHLYPQKAGIHSLTADEAEALAVALIEGAQVARGNLNEDDFPVPRAWKEGREF